MNMFLVFVILILFADFLVNFFKNYGEIKNISLDLPKEFSDIYDLKKYEKNQQYIKENLFFSLWKNIIFFIFFIAFILLGAFNYIDLWVRSFSFSEIISGIIFTFILLILNELFSLPFEIYHTFFLEKKWGFNKTTPLTFLFDKIKMSLISIIIFVPILYIIFLFFHKFDFAWAYSWLLITFFSIFFSFVAPSWIMPLFNKFTPLKDGELKEKIFSYAKEQKIKLANIFVVDGSKRSTKANAYFTGFGSTKKIVLYDTLIEEMQIEEIVAVFAHEVGHYKLKHIVSLMIINILHMGLIFFLLSLFYENPLLFQAFGVENISIYMGMVLFSIIFIPINFVLSILMNLLSRKNEFAADNYAKKTYKAEYLISALKKLCKKNFSNLCPTNFKVILDYSHPPVLQRILALKEKN